MFRILIIEDIENTLREIKEAILLAFAKEEVPAPRIDTATSVAEGEQFIREAYDQKKQYHAVILDFYLPEEEGYDAMKMNESLCLLLRDLMPNTLVAHITAYPDYGPVKDHLREVHHEQIDPRAFALSKLKNDYGDDLIRKLKAFLFGMRIEEQIESIFGQDAELSFSARGRMRNRPKTGGSLTHSIAALSRDIESYWYALDHQLQERIRRIFRVETFDEKEVRVSLLHKAAQ